ncbi:MAG: Ig-like domain-containing protein, partial [Desulfobulbaceae bacterium]|nr:Ig-like domain-containing protein [Desulfobulbaceae bacterium]
MQSDGKGNWTLELDRMLPEGRYDVAVTVADAVGNTSTARKKGLLAIDFTPPAKPAITHAAVEGGRIIVEGVWPSSDASRLIVTVDGKSHELGRDRELVRDGKDRWRLTLYDLPADGTYDVTVTAVDRAGNRSQVVSKGALVVDTRAPAIGDLTAVEVKKDGTVRIRGTWNEEEGAILKARLGDRAYVLGRTEAFVSDGRGHWTLATEKPLKPGSHDLVLDSEDAAGNRAHREFPAAVIVAAPKPVKPELEEVAKKEDAPAAPADTTPPAAPT